MRKHLWIAGLACLIVTVSFAVYALGADAAAGELREASTPPDAIEDTTSSQEVSLTDTLLSVAKAGELYAALDMVKAGAKDELRDEEGKNVLLIAAENQHPELVRALLDGGDDLMAQDLLGNTALHLAVKANDVYTADMLIEDGIPLNAVNSEFYSPLHVAAAAGSFDCVRYLVEHGANPMESFNDALYLPAYTVAGQARQWDVTAYFREQGADMGPLSNAGTGDIRALEEYVENEPTALSMATRVGITPLHSAVGGNQVEAVRFLLEHDVQPAPSYEGITPQMSAVRLGYTECLRAFFEFEVTPNDRAPDFYGYTLLMQATRDGNVDMMQFLMDQGADMGYPSVRGDTALHAAVEWDQPEAALFLLDQGFIIDIKNGSACSALHLAAEKNKIKMARLLLDHGASLDITDKRRWTPLHIAVDSNHLDMIQLLLNRGANISAPDKVGDTPLLLAIQKKEEKAALLMIAKDPDLSVVNEKGEGPLYLASRNGLLSVVKSLLDKGAPVDTDDDLGQTPLYAALQKDHYELARLLAEKGADLHRMSNLGESLLFPAAYSETADALTWLCDAGLDVHIRAENGLTPLHMAARYGSEAPVIFLLEKGVEVNAQDVEGRTPLHLASGRGHIINVQELAKGGADLFLKDKEDQYALHAAARNGHWGPVQLFLVRGIDINSPDIHGDTALHLTARGGFHRTAKLLLVRGADFTLLNKAGETPLVSAMNAFATLDEMEELSSSQLASKNALRSTVLFYEAVVIDEYRNAVERSDVTFLKRLLAVYEDYKDAACFGCTPVYRAVRKKDLPVLQLLLDHGADPSLCALSDGSQSPLHLAVHARNADLVQVLLDAGAPADTPDGQGMTPLDLAKKEILPEIAALLKNAGDTHTTEEE